MKAQNLLRSAPMLSAAIVLGLSAFVGAQPAAPTTPAPRLTESAIASFGGEKAPTRASRDSTMSFTFPVEIAAVLVKGGQHIKKGDILVQGRDDEYRLQRDLQKTIAESDLEIQHAQAEVDQAGVEFKAQEILRDKKTGGTPIEFEGAKTVLTVKQVELALAKLQSVQQKIKLSVNQAQLDRLTLRAPFDGIVDNVLVDVGEVKKETEPILKIVAPDPMWMDVNAPTELTLTLALKPGDKAWVLLDVPGEPAVYLGKVIELGAESDFAGQSRRVRVELPNPGEWPVGPAAWVRFTAPEGEWAKRITEPKRTAAAKTPASSGASK